EAREPGPDLLDHAAALVAEDGREEARRIAPAHRVGDGVADAGRDQADQALAGARTLEVDLVDHERLARLPADGGENLHGEWEASRFHVRAARDGTTKVVGQFEADRVGSDAMNCSMY